MSLHTRLPNLRHDLPRRVTTFWPHEVRDVIGERYILNERFLVLAPDESMVRADLCTTADVFDIPIDGSTPRSVMDEEPGSMIGDSADAAGYPTSY